MIEDDSFFGNSSVEDLAEEHAMKIQSLSEKEAERVLRVYKNVRGDLRDRLDSVSSGTFTHQKMQGTLAQVDSALIALQSKLKTEMGTSAENIAGGSVYDLTKEFNKYQDVFAGADIPINLNAAVIASDVKNLLMTRIESSFDTYNTFLRSRISQGLSESVIAQDTFSEVVKKINITLMGEQWKAQQIVRTELHNVYSMGKIEGMRDMKDGLIPDIKKALYNPMDSRTGKDSIYADKLRLIVDVDDYFEYRWKGVLRRFFQPPDRPNDRAILIPYRESWG